MKSDREDYTDSGFETASEHVPKKLRKAPVATIKYAQKIAMQRGDADTRVTLTAPLSATTRAFVPATRADSISNHTAVRTVT